ncbi:hypothetical protein AVEN_196987-1 [Araneus ventricosus]|uniref:Uncharacterized protein n=1 Tax=Araneus ventricosus TaxID=182803 RepID=A0A4Y2EB54_ARAVE|nr:hypothetical protein AVEN_196987-1 [Araneus ventricosus]
MTLVILVTTLAIYVYNAADWQKFSSLADITSDIVDNHTVDEALENIISIIKTAADVSIPLAKGHDDTPCIKPEKCGNCNGSHPAYSKSCPKWKTEKEIQAVKITRNIFAEARKIVESRTPKVNLPYNASLKTTTCSCIQTDPIQILENDSPTSTVSPKPFPTPANEEYITIKLTDRLEIIKSNKPPI